MEQGKTCEGCGSTFEVAAEFSAIAKHIKICPACSEKQIQKEDAETREKLRQEQLSRWQKLCPPEFATFDYGRLPRPNAFNKVQQWTFGKRGMILHGPTGNGKSRSLYALIKREFQQGREIRILDHSAAFKYAATFTQSAAEAWEWVQDKSECELLAMDDLFKAKLSESFEQAIFTIISTRTEWGRPIILTTQDVGKTLEARMSADRGPATLRRFREFFEMISFA